MVDKILFLNKRLSSLNIDDEKLRTEKEIKKVETEIDNLVYKIFKISENEKEIIENSFKWLNARNYYSRMPFL